MNKLLRSTLSIVFSAACLTAAAQSPIVISQVYGGGGNVGALFKNDFIELFNSGTVAVSVGGWSVQYAAAAGTSWSKTNINGTIQPGGYFLIQEASGGTAGSNLPTADIAGGTLNMATAAGKVALVNSTTTLSGGCPTGSGIQDFVGYGTTANCSEGGATAPAPV